MCNFSNFFDRKIIKKILDFFKKFITVINPLEYRFDMAVKPHLNLIVTGHIDNGKSTTMGHTSPASPHSADPSKAPNAATVAPLRNPANSIPRVNSKCPPAATCATLPSGALPTADALAR